MLLNQTMLSPSASRGLLTRARNAGPGASPLSRRALPLSRGRWPVVVGAIATDTGVVPEKQEGAPAALKSVILDVGGMKYAPAALESVILDVGGMKCGGCNAPAALESVILDVGGMKCGGCSAAVKRMLLARPDVDTAAVNLLTETAVLRVRGSAASLGLETASMLSSKGFPAKVRSESEAALASRAALQKCAARAKLL
eukprot:gene31535-6720_t